MDHPFNSPAILSLCTGLRGIERGLERAIGKFTVAAYAEIEAFICANLIAGMESGFLAPAPIWTDVKTFPSQFFRGKIHGIIGGYPCQPFSNAGNRKGTEDPRHLWPYICDHIRTIKPLWCFFENVSGHLSLGYDIVYKSLRDLGYSVEAGIFTAEEVGAPHERERLFILAVDNARCHRFKQEYKVSAGWHGAQPTSEAVANTGSSERRPDDPGGCRPIEDNLRGWDKEATRSAQCGKDVANPESSGERGAAGNVHKENGGPDSQLRFQPDGSGSEISLAACVGLADTNVRREQPGDDAGVGRFREPFPWPAGPGQLQHPWELPRTLESCMGCTIDGYNFREDLLRALGNSVVEQTATIAFIDLLKKHSIPCE